MYRILIATLIFCGIHSSQSWADIQVQGYLNKAALENLAADPTCAPSSTCPDGRIYWNTTAGEPRMWDGSTWQEIPIGASTVPDPLLLSSGSEASPTYSFTGSSSDDGMWLSGSSLRFSTSGTEAFVIGSTVNRSVNTFETADGDTTNVGYGWVGDENTGFYRFGEGDVAFVSNSNVKWTSTDTGADLSINTDVDGANGVEIQFYNESNASIYAESDQVFFRADNDNDSASAQDFIFQGDSGTAFGQISSDLSAFYINTGGSETMCTSTSGAGYKTLRLCPSSQRYKENISDVTNDDLDKLYQLRPVEFDWKEEIGARAGNKRNYGFIAEEAALVLPKLVNYSDDSMTQIEGFRYRHLTALLVGEIKRLKARIEALEAAQP